MEKENLNLYKTIVNHPFLIGVLILVMNLCSRHIMLDIPEEIQTFMQNIWVRRIAVFSVVFISTRNVEVSLLITLLFVIIFQYLLNKGKRICLLKKSIESSITDKEYMAAKKIVDKYQLDKIKQKLRKEDDSS